jgi:hypothetical protein
MPIGLITNMDASKRESLLSVLKNASPNVDNYLTTNLGVAEAATQPLSEWVTYNAARATTVTSTAEGADYTFSDLSAPVRSNNYTTIVTEPVQVSKSEQATKVATNQDPWAFQKAQAIIRLKNKMEWLTINGAIVSGISGTGRVLAGIDGCISTNVTARTSGTSFTETELNDIMQESWNAVGSQYVADLLLVPAIIKRRIAGFTTGVTRNINAAEKKMITEIQVYQSQLGNDVMVIPHKDVRAAAGTVTVYAIREDLYKQQFLTGREPMWEDKSSSGSYDRGVYETEFTVVSYEQKSSVRRTGFASTL